MSDKQKKLLESALHQQLENFRIAKEHEEKLQRIQEKVDYAVKGKQIAASKGVEKKLREAGKYRQIVDKMHSGESSYSNKSLQVGTFFSWIMDSVPEFEAIVKTIVFNAHAMRKQYLGDPASIFFVKNASYVVNYTEELLSAKGGLQLPAIKYITNIDAEGKFNVELIKESFGGLLNDADGNYSQQMANEIYQIFQGYIAEWIESLDGLDDDVGGGYFIVTKGNDMRIYPKSSGTQNHETGAWLLTPGQEDTFVKAEDYAYIAEGCGYPDKSLREFLRSKCHDVELEEAPRPSMGM